MKATILESVDEQVARGDRDIVDPSGCTAATSVPVFRGFEYRPENLLGHATNIRVEAGRLVADMDLREPVDERYWRYGVGGKVGNYSLDREPGRLVHRIEQFHLLEIGVVAKPPLRSHRCPR